MKLISRIITCIVLVLGPVMPSSAGPPVRQTTEIQFDDINACSGAAETTTIVFQDLIRDINGRTVDTSHTTASTSPTGYIGHGDQILVANDNENNFTAHVVLTNDAGSQIVITRVFHLDLKTNTIIVDKLDFNCVH